MEIVPTKSKKASEAVEKDETVKSDSHNGDNIDNESLGHPHIIPPGRLFMKNPMDAIAPGDGTVLRDILSQAVIKAGEPLGMNESQLSIDEYHRRKESSQARQIQSILNQKGQMDSQLLTFNNAGMLKPDSAQ